MGWERFLDSIPRKIGVRGRRAYPNPTQVEQLVELLRGVRTLVECAETFRAFVFRASLVQMTRERGEQGLQRAGKRLDEQVRERRQRTQDEQRFLHRNSPPFRFGTALHPCMSSLT